MRAFFALLLVLLPALAAAGAPGTQKPSKRPAKTKPAPPPTPAPEPELDAAAAAERDQVLADAKHKLDMAEFLESRALYRKAIALDPASADAKAGLASAEKECLDSARHQISEAKVFKSAFNHDEAMKALQLALQYADQPHYKENQTARDLIAAIKRESER